MTPRDTSDYELLLYADWLLDHGRDEEADEVRRSVYARRRRRRNWSHDHRGVVGVGGVRVGGGAVSGFVSGFGGVVVGAVGGSEIGGSEIGGSVGGGDGFVGGG